MAAEATRGRRRRVAICGSYAPDHKPPSPAAGPEVRLEVRVGHRRGLHPDHLDALVGREPGDRAEHRHPVVAARVERRRRAAASRRRGRRSRPRSPRCRRRARAGPSTTPSIRSDSLRAARPRRATTVSPSAKAPSSATSVSSSIASGTSSRLDRRALERRRRRRRARRPAPRRPPCPAPRGRRRSPRPSAAAIRKNPVRVQLSPTSCDHDARVRARASPRRR